MESPRHAVIVPVKDFSRAKLRLATQLDPAGRARLARDMASGVVAAAAPLPVFVVCDADNVRDWATDAGAEVLWTPGRGLNGAVQDGIDTLVSRGYDRLVVAHADLPLASSLAWVADFDGVTVVPDRHLDGTNVLGIPARAGFQVAYGPGSFARHRTEAAARGEVLRIVRHRTLAWDVDVPADLLVPADLHGGVGRTARDWAGVAVTVNLVER